MSSDKLTKKERRELFQVYRDAFPDWEADVPYSLMRTCGPITQVLGFDTMSDGSYRFLCGIEVSGPPDDGSTLLPQLLKGRHSYVRRREHATMWQGVVRDMEEPFIPNLANRSTSSRCSAWPRSRPKAAATQIPVTSLD